MQTLPNTQSETVGKLILNNFMFLKLHNAVLIIHSKQIYSATGGAVIDCDTVNE
jgi:hypothetical protein